MNRKPLVLGGAIALAVATAAGSVVISRAKRSTPTQQDLPAMTAKVQQRELSAMVSLGGILGYQTQSDGTPYSVINQAHGTYTELPIPGQAISQGQVLYRVDENPVVLLNGATPAFRTLSMGTAGADVAELNADLVALGDATSAQLSPSSTFGSATAAALQKLQASLGATPTGILTLGQAVFEPTTFRVTIRMAQLGGSAETGQAVLQGTSTARVVQVALDASQQTEVAVGDPVIISLPNDESTPGSVSSVGTVATCPSGSGPGGPSSGPAELGMDNCSSGGSGNSTTPTIAVVVTPSDPEATGEWDQAPVRVTISTAKVPKALAVPISALLARANGGYAVEVLGDGGRRRLVGVSLGLFDDADGLVQVTGARLAAGQRVVVPAI